MSNLPLVDLGGYVAAVMVLSKATQTRIALGESDCRKSSIQIIALERGGVACAAVRSSAGGDGIRLLGRERLEPADAPCEKRGALVT